MPDTTPQKRVLPARERAESALKRRAASPVAATTPASEPRQKRKYTKRASLIKTPSSAAGTPSRSTPSEDILPTRLQTSRPLPTSSEKQPEKLSKHEYQSVAESAVLAASLYRSRMQWLCEGIFTRYWRKPVKRKGVIEQPPGNPDAKSMSKLGNATMTIEPHVFDVTFYTVKDYSSVPPPYHRHPNQHTVKQAAPSNPTPSGPLQPSQNAQPSPVDVPKGATTPAVSPFVPSVSTAAPAITTKQETPPSRPKDETTKPSLPTTTVPVHPVAHPPTQSVAPAPVSDGSSKSATDPVIQMLAARAATDNRLKELMQVVATSKASAEQLREFQAHIDEFNKIIKQQEAKNADNEKPKPPPLPTAAHPSTYNNSSRPHPGPPTSIGGPMTMAPPVYASHPPPRPEPFIKHIIVEFHSAASVAQSANTDRWLFPEHAILEIRSAGMEMVASFFVVRKGDEIVKHHGGNEEEAATLRQKYASDVEYYQPVTVLVKATHHRIVETIARAAKPLADCQKHMKETMETKTRAPNEYLIHRLPRDRPLPPTSMPDFVDSAVEMSNDEDDELRDVYRI